jgi:hypothetical protein
VYTYAAPPLHSETYVHLPACVCITRLSTCQRQSHCLSSGAGPLHPNHAGQPGLPLLDLRRGELRREGRGHVQTRLRNDHTVPVSEETFWMQCADSLATAYGQGLGLSTQATPASQAYLSSIFDVANFVESVVVVSRTDGSILAGSFDRGSQAFTLGVLGPQTSGCWNTYAVANTSAGEARTFL